MVDALRFFDCGVLKGALIFCRRHELRVKNLLPESTHRVFVMVAGRRPGPDQGSRPHEEIGRENIVNDYMRCGEIWRDAI